MCGNENKNGLDKLRPTTQLLDRFRFHCNPKEDLDCPETESLRNMFRNFIEKVGAWVDKAVEKIG